MLSPSTCIERQLWLALLLSLFSSSLFAANIETLLMPGKVIEGHAKKESECTSCHTRFSKETQNTLCLDCHKKVNEDVRAKTGYHGRSPQISDANCSSCHTDHKGRNATIVLLDRELFDHKQTDFKLEGGHRYAQCNSCHKEGKLWRESPSNCFACHKEQDIHKGELGEKCADCHSASSWSRKDYDHSKTDFALKGAHEKVACVACHPNRHYKEAPKSCVSCHRGDDVHLKGYGEKCDSCHDSSEWNKVKFDHAKTEFKLQGAHESSRCAACHKPGKEAGKLATTCISCHRTDDSHKGRNGERCQECHNSSNWGKSRFSHDKETKFPLRGPHTKASCNACHAGGVKKDAPVRNCIACHKADDVHRGDLGKECDSCHKVEGWQKKVTFDHDLTRLPLYGMHALASCEVCHSNGRYASLPRACIDCHKSDDTHKGALGESCGDCHNANGWMLWTYDHDKTDFSLDGAHQGLACKGCHIKSPADKTPVACVSCHEADDEHRGRFGRNCNRCHNTTKFKDVRLKP
jgi:hypothetical protein